MYARSLLVLIDGLGDDPIPAWDGLTPFERAEHPHMDRLAAQGKLEEVSVCGQDLVPGSLTCILRLLGVPKEKIPANRAYLELLAEGRDVSEYEMVLRCNVISQDSAGRLVSFNGMGLTPRELREIAGLFNHFAHTIEFLHLSDYRNLLIMNRKKAVLDVLTAPPHESMGMVVDDLLADLKAASLEMKVFTQEADRLLQKYSRNDLRYRLYPWGASCRTEFPSFRALHGMDGALVGQTEIVRGIGKALGMEVPPLQYCTADIDTDVREKLAVTRRMLSRYPFVMTHFNGTDEAAHRHDYEGKARFISRIDREFLGPLLERGTDSLQIVICGDHVTSSVTGRHTRGKGPVLSAWISGTGTAAPVRGDDDLLEFIRKVGKQNG